MWVLARPLVKHKRRRTFIRKKTGHDKATRIAKVSITDSLVKGRGIGAMKWDTGWPAPAPEPVVRMAGKAQQSHKGLSGRVYFTTAFLASQLSCLGRQPATARHTERCFGTPYIWGALHLSFSFRRAWQRWRATSRLMPPLETRKALARRCPRVEEAINERWAIGNSSTGNRGQNDMAPSRSASIAITLRKLAKTRQEKNMWWCSVHR